MALNFPKNPALNQEYSFAGTTWVWDGGKWTSKGMSSGLPILYSASGGIPELVGKNSGIGLKVYQDWESIHVPTKKQIFEGFFQIIENRKVMSDNARKRALELFDLSSWIKKHEELDYFYPVKIQINTTWGDFLCFIKERRV